MFFILLYFSLGPCAYLVAAWVFVGNPHRSELLATVGVAALLIGLVELIVGGVLAAFFYQASPADFLVGQIPHAAVRIRYAAFIAYGAVVCAALCFLHSLAARAHSERAR